LFARQLVQQKQDIRRVRGSPGPPGRRYADRRCGSSDPSIKETCRWEKQDECSTSSPRFPRFGPSRAALFNSAQAPAYKRDLSSAMNFSRLTLPRPWPTRFIENTRPCEWQLLAHGKREWGLITDCKEADSPPRHQLSRARAVGARPKPIDQTRAASIQNPNQPPNWMPSGTKHGKESR